MQEKHYQKALATVQTQTLYVVATPIGNLADISLRALAVLQRANLICAEDTRISAQLLRAYGISAKLLSVREHNERQMAEKVVEALGNQSVVAQISDAGTPAICDPGAKLVERVRQAGFAVVPVVGASALMGALSVAGISAPNFYFHGFLPPKSGERIQLFERWQNLPHAVVAFETPHRIEACLSDMARVFPDKTVMLAREISKSFETFLLGTVNELQNQLRQDGNQARGEMVVILYPQVAPLQQAVSDETLRILKILAQELPTKQVADLTSKITGGNKKALYDLALTLKNQI